MFLSNLCNNKKYSCTVISQTELLSDKLKGLHILTKHALISCEMFSPVMWKIQPLFKVGKWNFSYWQWQLICEAYIYIQLLLDTILRKFIVWLKWLQYRLFLILLLKMNTYRINHDEVIVTYEHFILHEWVLHSMRKQYRFLPSSDRGVCMLCISSQVSRHGSYLQTLRLAFPSGYSPPARYR